MIWYVEENERKYPTVIPFHGILLSGMLRKTFRIDELRCCSYVEVLVCNAVKKCTSVGGRKTMNERRTTNEERRTNEWLVRIFAILLVRIPIDWYEFRSIGPNSERLVRIPNEWRTTNDVATDVNAFDVVKFVKVFNAPKKSAWTDLDRVSFKKIFKESKRRNWKIGVDWSRQS